MPRKRTQSEASKPFSRIDLAIAASEQNARRRTSSTCAREPAMINLYPYATPLYPRHCANTSTLRIHKYIVASESSARRRRNREVHSRVRIGRANERHRVAVDCDDLGRMDNGHRVPPLRSAALGRQAGE
ncbi:hypothetical protein PsYK624_167600 [Phanerochaete sordida]|uniref:Uncharacterized protein n=1 Tax=Phanerochaete sordida TaxID=48140 RepID=A0A9P3GT40_9APHY|nr:hypothetical protein PsYK624_167600 [Phanerochaete sordida]